MQNNSIDNLITVDELIAALIAADPNTSFFKMYSPLVATADGTIFEARSRKLRTSFSKEAVDGLVLYHDVDFASELKNVVLREIVDEILAEIHSHVVKMMVGIFDLSTRFVGVYNSQEFVLRYAMQPLSESLQINRKPPMITNMRAKFVITGIKQYKDDSGLVQQEHIEMYAVGGDSVAHGYPKDGSDEDSTFSKYTPNAHLTMEIQNPNLFGVYKAGDKLYCDFSLASKA